MGNFWGYSGDFGRVECDILLSEGVGLHRLGHRIFFCVRRVIERDLDFPWLSALHWGNQP